MLDVAIETLEPAELADAPGAAAPASSGRTSASRSEFYRGRLPEEISLDALQDVAFTDKEELRASQEAAPPFGDYVGDAEDAIVRLHRTSGMSGSGMNLGYTDARRRRHDGDRRARHARRRPAPAPTASCTASTTSCGRAASPTT